MHAPSRSPARRCESRRKVAAVNDTLGWMLVDDGKAAEGLKYLQVAVDTPDADS